MTSPRRWLAWWFLAERAVSQLAKPPSDVAGGDAGVERLLTGSSLFAIARSIAAKTRRAWTSSRTSRLLHPIVQDLSLLSMTDRLRVGGLVAAASSLTALVFHAADPTRTRWLDSVLAGAVAVVGVFVVTAARPIARALADKRK